MMNCRKDGTFHFFNHKNLKLRQKTFCYLLVLLKNSRSSLIEIVVWILYLPFPHRQKCKCLLLFRHSKVHLLPRALHTLSLTTTPEKNKPYCQALEDPLENEMATCSSIGAWEIPWTEKPGGLQSEESQRVRYD